MNLGLVLRKWRMMSEMTMDEVASATGVDRVTLNRLERGFTPSGTTLARLLCWLLASPKKAKE